MSKGGWINPEFNYGKESRQWLGHSFRYYLARGFLEPTDIVLDAACGVGYGAHIMARACKTVLAWDADEQAIEIAMDRYQLPNIRFLQLDFDGMDRFMQVDVAVSFETIEHLERDPRHFAGLLKASARRLIIISAPVTPTVGVNPNHRHDFTEQGLLDLFVDKDWKLWEVIRQGPYQIQILSRAKK